MHKQWAQDSKRFHFFSLRFDPSLYAIVLMERVKEFFLYNTASSGQKKEHLNANNNGSVFLLYVSVNRIVRALIYLGTEYLARRDILFDFDTDALILIQ